MRTVAIFPCIMLVCYIILIVYFQSKGGYKPIHIGAKAGVILVLYFQYTWAVKASIDDVASNA